MLRRNMKHLTPNQKLGLEDLLGDLWHARRRGDLGRLALLSYYEVRRWARASGETDLAEHTSVLVHGSPFADRACFLRAIDLLISELEQILKGHAASPVHGRDAAQGVVDERIRPGAHASHPIRH